MHPFFKRMLAEVAETGAKAIAASVDSVLEDVDGLADEVKRRTGRAREKARTIKTRRPKYRDE